MNKKIHLFGKTIKVSHILLTIIMFGIAFLMIAPFLWVLSASFRTYSEATSLPPKWLPPFFTEMRLGYFKKLYRININTLEDPLQNESLLEQVGPERRKKVIRYLQPDDRKRSLGAGIMIRKILNGNGLSESSLKYSENGKPLADHFHFNISHAGEYVVGVVSDGEVGCDIERNVNAPLEIAEHYFHSTEREYIEAASDPGKAFFTLWTLKESYMKMTGRGMSLPLDSFEIIRKDQGFVLGKSPKRPGFFRTMEFENYIFSVCMESDFSLPPKGFTELL